ncbi:uncharacterized protein LOC119679528 isoform X2 [Teleopsis dalmanni]|uniref:uncharacterized protein LOC119679528 isoform X2 n=1 Tax=Teleopsis dalmanni TaxID=139649 RepID=UPI0018CDA113|nr:uncharacterized protein LOC119679528 isoform X2 [Teleopsis dalmanni]
MSDNYRIFISKKHLCFSRWSSGVPLFWSKLPIENNFRTKKHKKYFQNKGNEDPTAFVIVNFRKCPQNTKPNLLNWKCYFKLKENKEHSFQVNGKVKAALNKLRQICRNGFLKYADWSKALKFIETNIRKTFKFDFVCEILLFSCNSLSQIGRGINRGKILRIQYTKNTLQIVSVEDQQFFDFLHSSNRNNPNSTAETKSDLTQLNKHYNTERVSKLSDWEYFSPIEINKNNYFYNQMDHDRKILKSLFRFSGNILEIIQNDGMDKIVIDPFKDMETIFKAQHSFIKSRCYKRTIPALTFTDNLTYNNSITKVVPKLYVHVHDPLISSFKESIITKGKYWSLKCSNILNNLNNTTEIIDTVYKSYKYAEIKASILCQLQSLTMIKELTINFCPSGNRQSLNNIKMLHKPTKIRQIDISADFPKNQIPTDMHDDIEEQDQMIQYRELVPTTDLSLSEKNRYPYEKKQCDYILERNLSLPVKSLVDKNYERKSDEQQPSIGNTSKSRNDFSLINQLSLDESQHSNANLYLSKNYFNLNMELSSNESHLTIGNASEPRNDFSLINELSLEKSQHSNANFCLPKNIFNLDMELFSHDSHLSIGNSSELRNDFSLDVELSPHEPHLSIGKDSELRNDFGLDIELSLDDPQTSVKPKERLIDLSPANVNDFRCCSQRLISIIKKDLYNEIFKRIRNYNINELFLLITFDGHKNYHIGIGKLKHPRFINCLYATKRAIKEADKDNLFMQISTTFLSL